MGALVSCIMPTQNRRQFLPVALECFKQQDWSDKELIVVDSGADRVEDLVIKVPGAKYVYYREENRPPWLPHTPIGTKRNVACENASGELICHWDDDDWSAPERIGVQAAMLQMSKRAVVGFNRIKTLELRSGKRGELAVRFATGTSLFYRKDFWAAHRFPATSFGEDWTFAETAYELGQLAATDGRDYITAASHPGNTCKR